MLRASALAVTLLAATAARAADPPAPVVPLPAAEAAAAPTESQAEGEMHASRALGHRLFRLGRYEEAVAAFRRAYELKADARLLYDIAECYREVGATDQALFYYDRYLAGWPDAFDRDEVEKKVAGLSSARARASGAVLARKRPIMVSDEQPAKPRPPRPWQRWWFWTAVGVVAAAGTTAIVLSARSGDGLPVTDLGSKTFF